MTKRHTKGGRALESIMIIKHLKKREVQRFAGFTKSTTLVESISLVFLLSGISELPL